MVPGSIIRATVMFGSLMLIMILGLMPPMVIGYIPIWAGPGPPITAGVGLRFITAGGFLKPVMVGFGYPAASGRLPG